MRKIFILFIAVFSITSCTNPVYETEELRVLQQIQEYTYGFEDVEFLLPEFSSDLNYELKEWHIHIEGIGYSSEFYTTSGCVHLSVVKNEPLCVVATPIFFDKSDSNKTGRIFYKPAGSIYPYESYSVNNLTFQQLKWECGFTADLMKSLFMENAGNNEITISQFISTFNWQKLQCEIDKKIEESKLTFFNNSENPIFYNPWLLDKEYLLKNISDSSFSSTYLNLKSVLSVDSNILNIGEELIESSFVPENNIIKEFQKIIVKKKVDSYFAMADDKEIKVNAVSQKNVSHEYVSMPIYEK